jgi:hypothetical protein
VELANLKFLGEKPMISKLAGVCVLGVGIAFMFPVVFGGAVLTGIGTCLVPGAIILGLVLIIL